MKDTFCILPFVHFYTQPEGEVKPCCIAGGFEKKCSLRTNSIEEIFNSDQYKQLRNDMLNGKRNKVCDVCYKKEDLGEYSPRQFYNTNLDDDVWYVPEISDDYSVPMEFQHIDIRFSNLCNFKCRMCNHAFSSQWYEDAQKIKLGDEWSYKTGEDKKVIHASETIIEDLLPYLKNLKTVYFAGGEPLINDQHYELLCWLHEHKKEIRFHYNTNLSVLNYKNRDFFSLWKDFKKVHLAISCDGIGKVGEYQRIGFKHDKFIENLNAVKKFSTPMSTTSFNDTLSYNFQYTTTIFNIEHIFDFIDFMMTHEYITSEDGIDFYYAWGPQHVSIRNLSNENKDRITKIFSDKISEIKSEKTRNQLQSLIAFMNTDSDEFNYIVQGIEIMDQLNNTDYKTITSMRF